MTHSRISRGLIIWNGHHEYTPIHHVHPKRIWNSWRPTRNLKGSIIPLDQKDNRTFVLWTWSTRAVTWPYTDWSRWQSRRPFALGYVNLGKQHTSLMTPILTPFQTWNLPNILKNLEIYCTWPQKLADHSANQLTIATVHNARPFFRAVTSSRIKDRNSSSLHWSHSANFTISPCK